MGPTSCSPGQKKYLRDHLSRGAKLVGDHLSMGTELLRTICPWRLNLLGTVCPHGPMNWGPIVRDQMSGDHMCSGPNVSQPVNLWKFKNWLDKDFNPIVQHKKYTYKNYYE